MKQIVRALALLAALLPSLAAAQAPPYPNLAPNTVIGRLGATAGPAQAIPFSILGPSLITNNLVVTAPLSIAGLNLSITGAAGKVLAGASPAFTATPQLGVASTTTGSLAFATSGNTGIVTVQAPSTATTWTFKFPTTAGSNGQSLITDGSGNTSWAAGTGTVNSGVAGQLTYYATTAAAVSGNANATMLSGTLTLGQSGSVAGAVIFSGVTSGSTTLQPASVATGTLNLPAVASSDTVMVLAATQTATNKTFTSPTINTPTIAGGAHTALTSLGIRDTSAAFDVTLTASSSSAALTAGRALILDVGNVAHTVQFGTTSNTITFPTGGSDTVLMLAAAQSPTNKTITSSTYNGLTVTTTTGTLTLTNGKTLAVSNSLTFTGTDGNSFAFPSGSDTVVTLAAAQTLTNKTVTAPTINGGTASALTNLGIRSTGTGAFDLVLQNTENLTAQRALTLTLNNAARTVNLSGNLTLAAGFTTAGGSAVTLTASGTTNVTLPTSGTLATIDQAQTFSAANVFSAVTQFTDVKFSSGKHYPTADSTTALQITKADGTTAFVTFDSTNKRVGINKTPGAFDLDVNGTVNVGTTLTFTTLDATSLGLSTSTITGLTVNNSPSSSNDYLLYYSAADGRIRKATVGSIAAGATAGVSSLNGLTGGLSVVSGTGVAVSAAGASVTVALSTARQTLPTVCAGFSGAVCPTSSSGTYTTPANVLYVELKYCGGGGGGSGAQSSGSTIVAGSDGTASSFNSVNANPGKGGTGSTSGGVFSGGDGGAAGTGAATRRYAGSPGGGGSTNVAQGNPSGNGGASGSLGGGGNGKPSGASAGNNGVANTGGGGSGAYNNGGSNNNTGPGGGGAECVDLVINNPTGTYSWVLGPGGAGGVSSTNGGTGAAGSMLSYEHYGT